MPDYALSHMRSEKEIWMTKSEPAYQKEDSHNYDRKLKINLKQTTTVFRMQNQDWSVLTLKRNVICSLT